LKYLPIKFRRNKKIPWQQRTNSNYKQARIGCPIKFLYLWCQGRSFRLSSAILFWFNRIESIIFHRLVLLIIKSLLTHLLIQSQYLIRTLSKTRNRWFWNISSLIQVESKLGIGLKNCQKTVEKIGRIKSTLLHRVMMWKCLFIQYKYCTVYSKGQRESGFSCVRNESFEKGAFEGFENKSKVNYSEMIYGRYNATICR